jgi:hypothetical protein
LPGVCSANDADAEVVGRTWESVDVTHLFHPLKGRRLTIEDTANRSGRASVCCVLKGPEIETISSPLILHNYYVPSCPGAE